MRSNVPITPQIADLGAAIVEAVSLVLADPQAAADTVQLRNEAFKLTQEEKEQLDRDRQFMKESAEERTRIAEWLAERAKVEADHQASADALAKQYEAHDANVNSLNAAVKELHAREATLEEEKQALALDKMKLRQTEERLLAEKEAVAAREEAVAKREDAIRGAAEALAGA